MNGLRLEDLPPPPDGRTGWPWTQGPTDPAPQTCDDAPTVTVVTPSFNQAAFIEETIRSILLQGYPGLEYMIVDGGSSDGTVEVIRAYAPYLAWWVSEPDRGQSHAINKGFRRASGAVLAWLNSDDLYPPSVLHAAAPVAARDGWAVGAVENIDAEGRPLQVIPPGRDPDPRIDACFLHGETKDFQTSQPAHFWRRDLWDTVGYLDERYRYRMDIEWMLRAVAAGYRPTRVDRALARFRFQPESKTVTSSWAFDLESAEMFRRLARAGLFRSGPARAAARYYASRGMKSRSDVVFADGKRAAAMAYAVRSWCLSGKMRGGDHWARVLRSFRPGSSIASDTLDGDRA